MDQLSQRQPGGTGGDQGAAYRVAALYKFAALEDCERLREPLLDFCRSHEVRGTLLLAREGINGTVAGSAQAVDELVRFLTCDPIFQGRLRNLDVKFSTASKKPFKRMKVRIKPEIVTFRAPEADPSNRVGTYVAAEEWNALISQPDVLLIDTRNDYEFALGTFEGACDPKTESFVGFKRYVDERLDPARDKKVAMFCTGGIRCEKATAYLLAHGFKEVYHLEGGILRYLEVVPREQSKWRGACFVFDERVAVTHGLAESDYSLCYACRRPLSGDDRLHEAYVPGRQCHHCVYERTRAQRESDSMRQRQMQLAERSGIVHLGDGAAQSAKIRRCQKALARERSRSGKAGRGAPATIAKQELQN